jgi:hypothetical protein
MMVSKGLGKRHIALLLTLSILVFAGWGCDGGTSGSVCTENISGVGSTSAARLYYPCNLSAPTGATTMSGGFMETLGNVDWLSKDIAESGYVVLAFTPSNVMGMVSQWKSAHKNSIDRLKALNTSHAKLRGLIDTSKLQTCGHSKGGGGSLWASSELKGELATTVGMAPWMEGFTANTLRSITAPTLIQAGAIDSLAVGSMTRAEYNGLGNIEKCYQSYPGYGHMAWYNASGSTASTLSGDIIAWMDYFMNGQGSNPCN